MKENRSYGKSVVLYVLFAAVALAIGFRFLRKSEHLAPSNEEAITAVSVNGDQTKLRPADDAEPEQISPQQLTPAPSVARAFATGARSAPVNAIAAAPRLEPSRETRQLVAALTNLDLSGPMTKDRADKWKSDLTALIQQGQSAIPAIREFLEQNQELSFGGAQDLLGQSSLRSALISALQQIGGADAAAVMIEVMQTSNLPTEIVQLAHALDQQAPGQYHQQSINAVNEILGLAEKGQLPGTDVGPLFQLLPTLGDSGLATLQQLQSQWRYYATLAIAGMPEGQGIPTLIRESQEPNATARQDLAFEMLAQLAAKNPDASSALISAARQNQISDPMWRKIASGLAGDQYQLIPLDSIGSDLSKIPGLKTFHIEFGNQNFVSLPVAVTASPDEIANRRALLEQLLAFEHTSAASQALRSALASLPANP